MLDINKNTDIYCFCDDFCKEINEKVFKTSIEVPKYRGCGKRNPNVTDSEIITILIIFHTSTFRNFKHYYLFYVLPHLKAEFPSVPSYSRFVTLMKRVGVPLSFFIKLCLFGECTGISFAE